METADASERDPDPGSSDADVSVTSPAPVHRGGRRRRTLLLIAVAAVTGVIAGTCTGYVIQAGRKPTALPSLSQPALAQAKGKGPEPLSAALDRRVKTDGDLRRLLLQRPGGARDVPVRTDHDGWISLAEYAEDFNSPAAEFWEQLGTEFRRAAATSWRVGDSRYVEIRLVQYRQEEELEAVGTAGDANQWAEEKGDTQGAPIPGAKDGMAYAHSKSNDGLYYAEAHAWRGDIAMEIWVYDSKPISKDVIRDLAQKQMERL